MNLIFSLWPTSPFLCPQKTILLPLHASSRHLSFYFYFFEFVFFWKFFTIDLCFKPSLISISAQVPLSVASARTSLSTFLWNQKTIKLSFVPPSYLVLASGITALSARRFTAMNWLRRLWRISSQFGPSIAIRSFSLFPLSPFSIVVRQKKSPQRLEIGWSYAFFRINWQATAFRRNAAMSELRGVFYNVSIFSIILTILMGGESFLAPRHLSPRRWYLLLVVVIGMTASSLCSKWVYLELDEAPTVPSAVILQ